MAHPTWSNFDSFAAWCRKHRNDLQTAALHVAPNIADILSELEAQPDCALARMSGSGATCFGLFQDKTAADAAAKALQTRHPNWWIAACGVLS